MMKKNYTLSMIASAVLVLTAMAVNAQDAGNPWHLTASENDVEVAFYNTEVITGIEVTAQTVTVALANGETFPHPVATTTFGFDPRAEGTGTANENITSPEWKAYYANGSLHFSEAVSGIAVYSLTGALVARFTGTHTGVPVNLTPGMYVIQAGGGSAKLWVGSNSTGGTVAQPAVEIEAATATTTPPAASLRAGTGAKIYWTVKAGNNTVSVEIPDVVSFRFTADNTIIFTLKNGNTVELADYQGVEFSIEPAPVITVSNWDLEKTFKFGGVSYVLDRYAGGIYDICVIAVAKDYIMAEGALKKIPNTNTLKKDIKYPEFLTKKLSYAGNEKSYILAHFSKLEVGDILWIGYDFYNQSEIYPYTYSRIRADLYNFNNGTPEIPAKIKLNNDGSLTMEFTDVRDGKSYTQTFPAP
jgi:hypothetical protein